ncbi:ABC transporter [Streptomyces roseirectus]|uniref:ABC transporter n=1 Tax=Streptomyces roseirectus TaxID=2768066 RepID=A0A7H0I9U9_9ACTN|nr:ABC transporter [Streptomyces roseirectus]QNP69565.1 ABC transporter [Streptomyces roseirectus]
MRAVVRYQAALLARSQRWLPPVLLYAVFLGVGVQGGQPILDSLGYAAAALLPVTAWLVRICAGHEPSAARSVVAAAVGPARAHLGAVLVGAGAGLAIGLVGTLVVTWISDPVSADHQRRVPVLDAAGAGVLAALACALLGTAVGVLSAWPVLRSSGRAVPALMLGALLALVVSGSPAQAAVSGLVTGSRDAVVPVPVVPVIVAGVVAVGVVAGACALVSRRTAD